MSAGLFFKPQYLAEYDHAIDECEYGDCEAEQGHPACGGHLVVAFHN